MSFKDNVFYEDIEALLDRLGFNFKSTHSKLREYFIYTFKGNLIEVNLSYKHLSIKSNHQAEYMVLYSELNHPYDILKYLDELDSGGI